jgi:hypothetical protein
MEQDEGEHSVTNFDLWYAAAGIPLHRAIFLRRFFGSSWRQAGSSIAFFATLVGNMAYRRCPSSKKSSRLGVWIPRG